MSPDLAVLDALEEFAPGHAMAAHQADADLQTLLARQLAEREHLAGARPVDGGGLLHEGVEPALDRVAELDPAERGGGGQQDDPARPDDVDRLLEAVEADELVVVGDVELVGVLVLDRLVAAVEPLLEDVGHRHQLQGAALRRQGVGSRARPSAAAADQADLDDVAARRMGHRDRHPRQRRDRHRLASRLQEITSCRAILRLGHRVGSFYKIRDRGGSSIEEGEAGRPAHSPA